ncbi:apoptosis inhibitor 5-like protein API5 [Panicum virgatum]|uniref:apoptosis inhibitor 5-like protein API5 n=1 Tax=Panicum virgatum TaxID=38727 RepID=UPI0019D68C9D|nr:apoptosis inhibitor 5-like protein API5 [Panicum virgatum]XP_039776993.1 apoptosis inhibitor 5-like protein API5 [Panicum virgatum]XP_039776994.1 apoptosis inhibitor 5-like protein API5 [Panicum virgatum]
MEATSGIIGRIWGKSLISRERCIKQQVLNYFVKQIVPAFEKIPEEKKLDLLKTNAASSPYAAAQDSVQLQHCYIFVDYK